MRVLEIETEHLRLRPWTLTDLDDLHRLWTSPEVRRYLWDDQVIPREQAAAVVSDSEVSFRTRGYGLWAAFPRAQRALIGFGGFRLLAACRTWVPRSDPTRPPEASGVRAGSGSPQGRRPQALDESAQIEILYGFAAAHWGKGLATEAVRALLRYGFEEHRFDHVIGITDVPNVASVRVLEKAGMTLQKRAVHHGHDSLFYKLSREAWVPGDATYRVCSGTDDPDAG